MFFRRKTESAALETGGEIPARPAREKLGWLEKRARRRRRRVMFEEILGWILVPAFIYLIYLGVKAIGGVPKEIIDFGNELIGIMMKGAS